MTEPTYDADTGAELYGDTGAGDHQFTEADYAQTVAMLGIEQTTDDDGPAGGDDVDDAGEVEQQHGPGREAQRLRGRLRDAQGQREAATARADAAQRGLVEHLVQASGIRPAAVWASGITLDDVLDDDGNVDPGLVQAAADHASSTLGLRRMPRPDLSQASAANHGTPSATSWQKLLQGGGK